MDASCPSHPSFSNPIPAPAQDRPSLPQDRLSQDAHQVLGTLAACPWSGPHRAQPLRKWTRLTPAAFDLALRELAELGLVELQQHDVFWVTGQGERQADQLFS